MINLYLKDSISIIEIVLIVPSRHGRAFGLGEIGMEMEAKMLVFMVWR